MTDLTFDCMGTDVRLSSPTSDRGRVPRVPRALRRDAEPLPPRQRALPAERRPARARSRPRRCCAPRSPPACGPRSSPAASSTRRSSPRSRPPATTAPAARPSSPLARRARSRARRARRPRPTRPRRWRARDASPTTRVRRPPGLRLDTGGTGKGLAADLLAHRLDRPLGGRLRRRPARVGGDPFDVEVRHPLTGETVHTLRLSDGAVATSGIDTRLWRAPDGTPRHHLLDPATGQPAWTGLIGATALAPTALEAEALAKAALLSGPGGAARWLDATAA